MTLDELILGARRDGASDLHLTGGAAPAVRILGQLVPWARSWTRDATLIFRTPRRTAAASA